MSSKAMTMTGSQSQTADSHSIYKHRPTVRLNALLTRLLLMAVFGISPVSGPAQDAAERTNGKTVDPGKVVADSSRIQLELRVITGDDEALSELLPPADLTGFPAMDEMQLPGLSRLPHNPEAQPPRTFHAAIRSVAERRFSLTAGTIAEDVVSNIVKRSFTDQRYRMVFAPKVSVQSGQAVELCATRDKISSKPILADSDGTFRTVRPAEECTRILFTADQGDDGTIRVALRLKDCHASGKVDRSAKPLTQSGESTSELQLLQCNEMEFIGEVGFGEGTTIAICGFHWMGTDQSSSNSGSKSRGPISLISSGGGGEETAPQGLMLISAYVLGDTR